MSDRAREPQILPEPGSGKQDDGKSIWLHGLWLVVMLILFEVSKVVLFVAALVQFGWRVFNQEENQPIADFGAELAAWQGATTQTSPSGPASAAAISSSTASPGALIPSSLVMRMRIEPPLATAPPQ